jgi:Lrp/AsnC family leucine-responsive transcriptional regulator
MRRGGHNVAELSAVERKILAILQKEGDISNVELAERVGMSPSPCLRKVKGLREAGYIREYVALLDRKKLGLQIVAYVDVKVPQVANSTIVEEFRAAVLREPAIVGCYITTGHFDFKLKVVVKNIEEYSKFLTGTLLKLPGVQDTSSTFVLDVFKNSTELPI